MVSFVYHGESWFQHSSFPVSHLREIVIHSRAANSMDIDHVPWSSFSAFSFCPGMTPATFGDRPLKATNSSCLKDLKVPRAKKNKTGMNSYFILVWRKPACLSKLLTILVYSDYKKIKIKKKFVFKLGVSWKHKQTSGNPPASVSFQNQCCTIRNVVELQLKSMLFWKMCWWDEWWRWGKGASEEICLLNTERSAKLGAFSLTCNFYYNIFYHSSEL